MPHDGNVHVFNIVQQAIGDKPKEHSAEKPDKNRAAVRVARDCNAILSIVRFRHAPGGLTTCLLDRSC
jgi:hypothetical protein